MTSQIRRDLDRRMMGLRIRISIWWSLWKRRYALKRKASLAAYELKRGRANG